MTFGVSDLAEPTIAEWSYASDESFHIKFNSSLIDNDGWNYDFSGLDNAGFDFSQARNAEERLVITLAHEAMHASHYARFQAVMRDVENNKNNAVSFLEKQGYSSEYISIFIEADEKGTLQYVDSSTKSKRLHNYMRNHNQGVIKAALDEYREDFGY